MAKVGERKGKTQIVKGKPGRKSLFPVTTDTVQCSVLLSADVHEAFKAYARDQHRNFSEQVRFLMEQAIADHAQQEFKG